MQVLSAYVLSRAKHSLLYATVQKNRLQKDTGSDCHNGLPIFRRLSPLYRAVCWTVDLNLAEQISWSAVTTKLTHFALRSPHLYAASNDFAPTSCALCSCPLRNAQLIFTATASVVPSRSNQPISRWHTNKATDTNTPDCHIKPFITTFTILAPAFFPFKSIANVWSPEVLYTSPSHTVGRSGSIVAMLHARRLDHSVNVPEILFFIP